MTITEVFKKSIIAAALFLSAFFVHAEIIQDEDFNFSLDIPEGFEVSDYTEDGFSYVFEHPNIPVTFVLKILYDNPEKSCSKNLKTSLTKLSAQGPVDNVKWSNRNCAVSNFSMKLDQEYKGWAICTPLSLEDSYLTLFCYAPSDKFDGCQQFIISLLNSLCINPDLYYTPGIIVTYAYPSEGKKEIGLNLNGIAIKSQIDKADGEASQFLVEMEYGILLLYAKHNLWKEAWQRYYRQIYRDNSGRLENVKQDIFNKLSKLSEENNPDFPDLYYAQTILTWVQNFQYKRAQTKSDSDFTSLVNAITGTGCDCDSRSMLTALLLNDIGIKSVLLASPEYSHAMVAALIDAPGQTITWNNREYLMGETTAKVTWGTIAADHSDKSKFFITEF